MGHHKNAKPHQRERPIKASIARNCPGGDKVKFPSKRVAKLQGQILGRLHGKEFDVYRCPICLGWHLTKKPEVRRSVDKEPGQ